jgi:dihydrofolate reductase
MRRIIVAAFTSLDGVMQAPGAPEEDRSGGFAYGGWTVPHFDEAVGEAMGDLFSRPFELLLGRRTYDIFAAHWPQVPVDPARSDFDPQNAEIARLFNRVTKYVATHHPDTLTWENSQALGEDMVATLRALKQQPGPDLLTQGSSELIQQLLAADLVDEIRGLVVPVLLGPGKHLFGEGATPAGLKLLKSTVSPSGVVIASYERAGAIRTGSFALEEPTQAELDRRKQLS